MKPAKNIIYLSIYWMLIAQACRPTHYIERYRQNGEKIDVYGYAKFGNWNVALRDCNKKYVVYYNLGTHHFYITDTAYERGITSASGDFQAIVDTSGGFYKTGQVNTDHMTTKYPKDMIQSAERIYISKQESQMMTEAVQHELEAGHKGWLREPIDSGILFSSGCRIAFVLRSISI